MGKKVKITIISLASLVSVILFLFIVLAVIKGQSLPKTGGKISLEGLTAPVEIIRDKDGIPHIYAENRQDLFFAQGYVHAQDRFWQMEFWRRIGAGRLSELFGEDQLDSDIFLRTMGFARVAQREFDILDDKTKDALKAYSLGVNAWIADRKPEKMALEFRLLKLTGVEVEIDPWEPHHSLTWTKVMSYDLGGNMSTESLVMSVLRSAGLSNMEDYISTFREGFPFIVSEEEYHSFREKMGLAPLDVNASSQAGLLRRTPGTEDAVGSNNWVISGEHTESGKPILANDMHLSIQMPSIWYEVALHCTGPDPLNVKGYSFAGVPGVVAGHNKSIAWGITNGTLDVQDLYYERLNIENPDLYWDNEQWNPLDIIYETIKIEGEDDPYVLRIRHTANGPLISDTPGYRHLRSFAVEPEKSFPENLTMTAVSLRWTALDDSRTLMSILKLDEAETYEEFREALSYWDCPGQNIVYADKEGNIAYQLTGKQPIRTVGTGTGLLPGWMPEYRWQGFIPFEDLPASLNPEKGYIVTANQPIVDDFYPYVFSDHFAFGYRAKRIVQLVEEGLGGMTVDDNKKIQFDHFSIAAMDIISRIQIQYFEAIYDDLEKIPEDETLKEKKEREKTREETLVMINEAYKSLKNWDGVQLRDSSEAAVFAYFFKELYEQTYRDQFAREEWPPRSVGRFKNSLIYLLDHPDHPLWDDITTPDTAEGAEEIIGRAFVRAVKEGREELGDDLAKWRWGDIHTADFRNKTLGESGIKAVENIFNSGPVPVDGGGNTVSVTGWNTKDSFKVNHIASQRAVYDMSDFSNSIMIHTTGQSGHPASRHYDDFIPLWQNGEYHGNLWEREDVLDNARKTLWLLPEE